MAIRNLHLTYKQGVVGTQVDFWLSDDDGPFNLDGWTVTFALAVDKDSVPVFSDEVVTNFTQTGDDIGHCYHILNSTTANIDIGKYFAGELRLVSGSEIRYWPTDANDSQTYFTVEVQTPIS